MEHPVKSNLYSALLYWAVSLLLGLMQATFNAYWGNLSIVASLADGLSFSLLFGLFGLAVWYVVRYNNLEKNSVLQVLFSHVIASVIFTSLWMVFSELLIRSLLQDPSYDIYIKNRFSGRLFEGFLFYSLLAVFYYLYVYSQNNKEKIFKEAELLDKLKEAQLNALKSQINPHFLFNSLNSIASLTLIDPPAAHQMIIALSDFMRYSLKKNINEMVTLETELQNIRLYLQIEKIRFGEKLIYNFEIEESCKKQLLPNLILQPVIENAIKHGLYETSGIAEINFIAKRLGNGILLIVTNGFDPDIAAVKGNGVGLKNISERLKIIYGSSALLKTKKTNRDFQVSIEIPDKAG